MAAYLDLFVQMFKYGVAPLVGIELLAVLVGLAVGRVLGLRLRDVALLCLAFGAIGSVTGLFMGASRDSVVGTIVPAFLTVVSGLAAYQFAAKGKTYENWRTALPVALACMFLAAVAGAAFGAGMRKQHEEALRRYDEWLLRYKQVTLPIQAQQLRQQLGLPQSPSPGPD